MTQTQLEGRKDDQNKPAVDLVPPEFILGVARVLEFGSRKYDRRNWEKGMKWGRVYSALMRHLLAWQSGEKIDPESGMPHLWHVATNVAFLIAYEERGVGEDDRFVS